MVYNVFENSKRRKNTMKKAFYTAPKADLLFSKDEHPAYDILLVSDDDAPADEWTENEK